MSTTQNPDSATSATLLSYATLRAEGMSRRKLERALRDGELVRVRRGWYVVAGGSPDVVAAARLGGRLDCLSLLHLLGVFVLDHKTLHIQLVNGSSRLPARTKKVVGHWRPGERADGAMTSDLVEALAQACRCQAPRAAIATLDSALHLGVIDESDVAAVFSRLPRRFRVLQRHIDSRSESGPETFVRLLLRALGCDVELQVEIDGVGRVDVVVDGWLIVECDSRAFHSSWKSQRDDRRRDMAAAVLGYSTLRLTAEDIMYRQETVLGALRGLAGAGSVRTERAQLLRARRSVRASDFQHAGRAVF